MLVHSIDLDYSLILLPSHDLDRITQGNPEPVNTSVALRTAQYLATGKQQYHTVVANHAYSTTRS